MSSEIIIRSIQSADFDAWKTMWTKYLEFYKSSVQPEVYQSTFGRFFEQGEFEPNCFVAIQNGQLVGLVHFLYHRHNWHVANACYLQDLYADENRRGTGIGRKLIEAVYEQADKDGAVSVYWNTPDFNTEARKLYDRIAKLTPFVKYQR